jgi:hypothetical protein
MPESICMSAPAQKPRPAPVSTITRTASCARPVHRLPYFAPNRVHAFSFATVQGDGGDAVLTVQDLLK